MAERTYLAVDLGAESGRVIGGHFDGRAVRLEEIHRFGNGPIRVAGSLRWDVLKLWSDIQQGLAKAFTSTDASTRVRSVGVDSWGVDYALFTSKGEMLGHPFNYRDPRTQGVMDASFQRVSRADIFSQTGLQFMPINTLYQLLAARRDDAALLALAKRFLMMADVFHWLLCGAQVVEFTNATTSQCLNATTKDWARDMLRAFDLPVDMFPPIVMPGTSLGKLRVEVSEQWRIPRLDVVAPATHDTGSAVVAVPTSLSGTSRWAYISSGTWSLMGLEVSQAILTPQALARNVTNEGGVDGTWRLLKNIMGLWLVQECRRSFERQGRTTSYADLTQAAARAKPFASLVDPDAPEFLAPTDMPTAIRAWCQQHGQPVPADDGALVRCALESLALKYRRVLGWLEELTGEKVEVIHVVGGGSQNDLLNQFTANACGRPVLAGPVEATALGNVLIQARSAGDVASLAEIREIVRNSSEIRTFEPQDQTAWAAAYERFPSA